MTTFGPASKLASLVVPLVIGLAMVCGLLFLFGGSPLTVAAAPLSTSLSGNIVADTTLTPTGNPYTVTGVVNIQAKLTIQPGVQLRFLPNAGFQVNNTGQLEAIGTPANPILFTSDSPTPARGDWNGITFEATSLTGTIEYAVIEYSKIGVELNSTTVPNIQFNILSNTFRFIGSGSPGNAAVIGSPDDTNISFNTVFSSQSGILLNEIGRTVIANNEVFDIDNHCIAVNSTGAASSDNQIINNQIHDCGARGIWIDGGTGSGGAANQVNGNQIWNTGNAGIFIFNQSNFNLRANEVFSTALNNTVSAVILNRANMSTLEDNYFHDNGVPGIYEGALHIADTGLGSLLNFPLQITGSRIRDSLGSGLIFRGTNRLVVPQTLNSNAICVDDRYEIENRSTVNVTAPGNWLGTNTPMVGTEITGTVQFNPYIQFSAATAPPIVPADGLSTAVVTVTMNDGAGHTMPVGARQIALTTNLGTLADSVVTLDANGITTTTITSNVAGTAIISLTEWCDVTITTTVEFQDTDLSIQKSAVSPQASPGSTITYTLTYSNDGALATNVVITDTLPAGTIWVSDTAESLGFTRLQTTPDVVWTIANLPATSSGVFTVVAQIPASASALCGQTLTNTAVITSATAESDPSNNTAVDSSVNVMCSDVGITKSSVLTQVVPGEVITYTIPYSNDGNTAALNVVITDTLPTGTVWLTDTAESLGFTRLQTAPEVVWSMASLGANISDTIVLVAQVQPAVGCGQVLTNSVVMTTTTADSDPANQSATYSVGTVCPDVTIVKSGPVGTLSSGQQITYTLTYSNIGQGRASNVVITDTSPITGGVITLTSGISLDPNTAGPPLSYSITVPDTACGTGALTNTAYISTSSPETNTGNNASTVSNPVICTDLVITKTATSVALSLGRVTTFTIAFQNTGTMTASNVSITDALDAITQYVTDTLGGASVGGGIVTWNIGDLGPGAGNTFEVGIEITPPVTCPPSNFVPYTNTVSIGSNETELVTSNNVSTATVSIPCGNPDLVVIKNDRVGGPPPEPSVVLAGGLITYTISYNNIGGATATNVVLTETLPANTIFVGPPQWTGGPSVYTRTVLDVPPFSGGVVNFVVQVVPTLPVSVTVVNNQVQIGSDQLDAYPPDNVSNEQTPVQAAPDLTVTKRSLTPFVVPGGPVTYAITVTNQGGVNADSVVITDTLPAGTAYVSNTVIGPPGSLTSPLVWNIGTLNAGQSQSFELTVQTDNGICSDVFLINTVEVRSATAEGDYTNNITSTNALNSPAIACEDLVITKTVTSPALSFGRVSTFTIAYQNAGIVTMTNTVITDVLDGISQYVTDTLGGAFVGGGNVVWNIGDVAPGTGGSFEVGIEINPATTCPASGSISFTNTALIDSDVPELVTSNNVSTATVTIPCGEPDLVVVKNDQVGGPPPEPTIVMAGGLITYTISYNNIGGATATNVVLTETLPANTIFVGPPEWTGGPSVYTRTVGDVPPFSGGVVTFVVQVAPNLPGSVNFVNNQVEIGSDETDAVPGDNSSSEQTPVQAMPDLLIEKTLLSPAATVGDPITYAITVTNQGGITATSVVVTDTLPSGTSYLTDTTGIPPLSTLNPVVWNIGQLNPGQVFGFNLTLQSNQFACIGSFSNTVETRAAESEGDTTNNIATAPMPALVCDDVAITKSVNTPASSPDQDVVFTLTYSNPGIFTATNVVVTDTLPAGITLVGSSPAPSSSAGNTYQWNIGNLGAGISNTIIITGHISAGAGCNSVLTNTAAITTTSTDGDPTNNLASAGVQVVCGVDLFIVKNDGIGGPTQPLFVQPGDVFTYSVSFNNVGTGPATNVVITETLPNFTSFVGPTGPSGWFQVGATNQYTYSLGTVNLGSGAVVNFAVQVLNSPVLTNGSFITNTVCIGSTEADVVPGNNCSFEQTPVMITGPRLDVTKTAIPPSGSNVVPGQTLTYTVSVVNNGTAIANNVQISDTLPAEVTYVTATLSTGGPIGGPNPLTASVPTLAAGNAVTMTIVVTVNNVPTGTIITNTAQAIADTLPVQASLPVTHVVTDTLPLPDLVITKTAQSTFVNPNDPVTYAITVTNQGVNPATSIVVSDTLPMGTSYLTDTTGLSATINGNVVSWNIGSLNPGQTFSFTLTANTNSFTCLTLPITNTVQAFGVEPDANPGDNTDSTNLPNVICDDVTITKSVNTPVSSPNQDVVFTLVYSNPGIFTATNVVITDTLPPEITLVSSSPAPSSSAGSTHQWNIGDLGAGISNTIIITGHVSAGAGCNAVLTNTAAITTTSIDGNLLNNTDSATVQVVCGVDMSVLKNDGIGGPAQPPFVQPGDVFTYSIAYSNLGTGPATNVVITETLPNFTSFVGPTGPSGWFQVGATNQYTYSLGTVNPGSGAVVDFVVQVLNSPGLTNGSFITNTVCIGSTEADVVPGNNCSFEQTPVMTAGARLDVVKTAVPPSGSPVAPGQTLTYTVSVLNSGSITANNVLITDTLPAEVTYVTSTLSTGGPIGGPNPLTASVPTLAAGNAVTMTIVVTVNNVPTGTIITNTAQAIADTLPVQASLPVTHVVGGVSNLVITKTSVPPSGSAVQTGDPINYTITVNNNGTATENNVVITDTLDPNVGLVMATTTTGTLSGPSPIEVSGFSLNPGETVTVTVTVTVTGSISGTIINNQAIASSTESPLPVASQVVTHVISGTPAMAFPTGIYLPIILHNFSGASASLVWVAQNQDPVSEVDGSDPQAFVADGRNDGAFQLSVNVGSTGPKTVDNVRLLSSQATGVEWDTIINAVPVLGIFDGGTQLNNADGTLNQVVNGSILVTLYASDDVGNTRFPPDTYDYTVIVTFTDGTFVTATARIPAPAPPPSPPPSPPAPACDLVAEITVGNSPAGIAIDSVNSTVYVANYGSDSVSVIDSSSNTVVETISGVDSPNGIAYDSTNELIWVGNQDSSTVTPIQTGVGASSATVLSPISVGSTPWGVAYDPVHDYVYVVNNGSNSVTVIDAGSQSVVSTISGSFSQPFHAAANPVTGLVYVTNFGNHTVTVLDGTSVNTIVNLNVGDPSTQPYGVAVDEIRNLIYVATVDSHRVVAIGTASDGSQNQLLGWAAFHRGFGDPSRPVPMRAIDINPDIGPISPMDDGGHVWTTTSTADGSEQNQALLIPKGWPAYFHWPVPCDAPSNPTDIAVDRVLDRAFMTSGTNPGILSVINDPASPPLVPFSADDADDGIDFDLYVVPYPE